MTTTTAATARIVCCVHLPRIVEQNGHRKSDDCTRYPTVFRPMTTGKNENEEQPEHRHCRVTAFELSMHCTMHPCVGDMGTRKLVFAQKLSFVRCSETFQCVSVSRVAHM